MGWRIPRRARYRFRHDPVRGYRPGYRVCLEPDGGADTKTGADILVENHAVHLSIAPVFDLVTPRRVHDVTINLIPPRERILEIQVDGFPGQIPLRRSGVGIVGPQDFRRAVVLRPGLETAIAPRKPHI